MNREYTNKLLEMVDEGIIDARMALDVEDLCRMQHSATCRRIVNEFLLDEDEDEDEEDEY